MNYYLLNKFNEVEKNHWWWEGRRELLRLFLVRENPSRMLDVGCGTGETLTFLQTLYPEAELFGVDSSAQAVNFCKKRGHKNIFKENATKLPFKDNYFDVVFFLDVLEHIKDDQQAINEAKRVLKRNGRIIITSPGLSFIWSNHDVNQGHKRRYTRREIRKLATNAGLKTSFISYFNFFLSPPIIAIRLLSRIEPLRSFANYDNSVNYDIAHTEFANSLLRSVFVKEIQGLKYIKYPMGISISAVFMKKDGK